MIWIIAFVSLAGIAACPILFAGLWTKKWFRVCCYLALWLLIGGVFQSYRSRTLLQHYSSPSR